MTRWTLRFGVGLAILLAFLTCTSCFLPSKRDRLFIAAEKGDTNEVVRLLALGVPVNSKLPSPPESTVLIHSLRFGQPHVAVVLLSAGADPNLTDVAGFGALFYALSSEGDTGAAIMALIKRGADLNGKGVRGAVELLPETDPKRRALRPR